MSVYLLATLDTKGAEAEFVKGQLKRQGVQVTLVDTGALGEPSVKPDVTREEVFQAAGTSWQTVVEKQDRGEAVTLAAQGAAKLVREAWERGQLHGVLGLGGSAGTTIGTAAMRALPLGVPKLMVSTLASGQVRQYVGDKDIFMLNSVVDILGVNRLSRVILHEAACAMAGMVKGWQQENDEATTQQPDRPLIAATMFGVTTPCVQRAKEILEQAGYEVLVFHATGNGGQAMESLIDDCLIAGVLDITTTELADELVGGILSAGPQRLTAAGRRGIPQVISVGATDMVNFGPRSTVPPSFQNRLFYQHNANVTLMRTTVEENHRLGEEIGFKAAQATGPTVIILPLQGVSAIDCAGQPFDDPTARAALFEGIRAKCGQTELVEIHEPINNALFAEAAASQLLKLLGQRR